MLENLDVSPEVRKQINAAASRGRLSSSIILEGTDAETRKAAALELAKWVLCIGDEKPCNQCAHCGKVSRDSHPDLHIVQRYKKDTVIKIDSIRNLKEQSALLPNEGGNAVFIILEAQEMNVQSQNALLKVFEEPSDHSAFILTCSSSSSLLSTIISRAVTYTLGDTAEAGSESEKAGQITENAFNAFKSGDEFEFFAAINSSKKDKELFAEIVRILKAQLHSELLAAFVSSEKQAALSLPPAQLTAAIDVCAQIEGRLAMNGNLNLIQNEFCSKIFSNR